MRKSTCLLAGVAMGVGGTLAAVELTAIGPAFAAAANDTYRQLRLFGDVFEKVRDGYVDPPDDAKLIEAAMSGMVASLDPHSSFLDKAGYRDLMETTRAEYGGLGIEITEEAGQLKVVSPIDGTPAARAGILAGDVITALDGKQVRGLALDQAVERMRGPIGSSIVMQLQRQGAAAPVSVRLRRESIAVKTVRSRVEGDVGYIRLSQFAETTSDDLGRAIGDIQRRVPEARLKGYVLDLRNDPGGLLDQAIAVADDVMERGEIVSVRGRHSEDDERANARPGDLTRGKPIVVLVNGGSASASEIVAGALQDQKRATVVGTTSFGKGLVQTVWPLGDDRGIRLTTARYYTPSGRSIQAKGIVPDIVVEQPLPPELAGQDLNRGESSLDGHLKPADGVEVSGSSAYVPLDPKDDRQLAAALGLLRGVRAEGSAPAGRPTRLN